MASTKRLSFTCVLATVLAGVGCNEIAVPDASSYGRRGTFSVGYRQLEAPGGMKVKAWYPADSSSRTADAITYHVKLKYVHWQTISPSAINGRATLDAALASEVTYPLVIFSHGYALNPEWYAALVEHYASHGFMVLAPEHAEDDWFRAAAASFDRPVDVKRTLDFAEALAASGEWAGRIDLRNVAVVGHSYGGYTALAAAGARFDLGPFHARCAALPTDDPKAFLCAPFMGHETEMAQRAGLASTPQGLWPTTMGDPRVTAIIAMAGDAYLMNEEGLASVTVPMMALGGTQDFGTPWNWGAKLAYDHASSRWKSLVAFEGADHMIAANPCDSMAFTSQLPAMERALICTDAPGWDRSRALPLIGHFSTAFLLDVLAGDRNAHAALLPGAAPHAGISYTATLP